MERVGKAVADVIFAAMKIARRSDGQVFYTEQKAQFNDHRPGKYEVRPQPETSPVNRFHPMKSIPEGKLTAATGPNTKTSPEKGRRQIFAENVFSVIDEP